MNRHLLCSFLLAVCALATVVGSQGQSQSQIQSLTVEEYEPRSTLVVPGRPVPRARYPFIDVHSHQPARTTPERLEKLVAEMDSINLRIIVNLSGGTGQTLAEGVKSYKGKYPDRFAIFATVSFQDLNEPDFGKRAAARLEEDVKNGAQGLKIYKNLGRDVRSSDGRRLPVDDPILDPVWETCARLKIPVLIHTGDPWPFFQPHDRFNERWLELKQFANRAWPPDRYPTWEALMAERDRLFARHPKTIFIVAHMGWMANNLAALGELLDRLPNTYVEMGAVLAELGRQPLTAHKWMVKYQDRVMFGKDIYNAQEYTYYFRCLETQDEYFDYYRRRHAHWKLYGFQLPDPVLKKIYYKNALKLIPGLNTTQFPP